MCSTCCLCWVCCMRTQSTVQSTATRAWLGALMLAVYPRLWFRRRGERKSLGCQRWSSSTTPWSHWRTCKQQASSPPQPLGCARLCSGLLHRSCRARLSLSDAWTLDRQVPALTCTPQSCFSSASQVSPVAVCALDCSACLAHFQCRVFAGTQIGLLCGKVCCMASLWQLNNSNLQACMQ